MNTSTSAPTASKATNASAGLSAAQDASIPAAHRAVLQRIAAQRERLQARRSARAQALALRRAQAAQAPGAGGGPDRLLAFARQHPVALVAAAGAAVVLGPRRLIRWSGIMLPLLVRMWR